MTDAGQDQPFAGGRATEPLIMHSVRVGGSPRKYLSGAAVEIMTIDGWKTESTA